MLAGVVLGFQRATIGVSTHLLRADGGGATVEVKLDRKGNKQASWLLAPPGLQPRTERLQALGSAETFGLLLAPPPPAPPAPGQAVQLPAGAQPFACH